MKRSTALRFLDFKYSSHPATPYVWIPGWGGTAHGLLPLIRQINWGSHRVVDAAELHLLRSMDHTSIEEMADLVANVLPQTPAHVVGISMGGIVAQNLAFLYQNRVAHLHLCCTNTGGLNNPYGVSKHVQGVWFSKSAEGEDPVQKILKPCFAQTSRESSLFSDYVQWIREEPHPVPPRLLKMQWQAMLKHGTQDYLPSLSCPVSLYAGISDEVVPAEDQERLKGYLANVNEYAYPGGHMFFLESATAFLRDLRSPIAD